ncbi:EAL domain-containing protein [Paracraurococcus lichenis]|uniref:EAL domain-containing protein n=1 Tax=Paracraurococcus lichenis TaxID=3064888 RepID=A0ABT9ED89_9PROT|nr:EAL domain-containing protein [Paracraurococcus sp. LOR1-02]MDO9714183.1 EAL domain-containing protein [Paracraurococcus sp. LOR1-02]
MIRRLLHDLPLARKLLLVPAVTTALAGIMVALAVNAVRTDVAAVRALDRDVFEPLNAAHHLHEGVSLLHAGLTALLLKGVVETNAREEWDAAAAVMPPMLERTAEEARALRVLLRGRVPDALAARVEGDLVSYVDAARSAIDMATGDIAFGSLLMLKADSSFVRLRGMLGELVGNLDERRHALVAQAVEDSAAAMRLMIGLAAVSAVLAVLVASVLGRIIASPLGRLTTAVRRLAAGDTRTEIPGTERLDEVGDLARAAAASKETAAALVRREAELAQANQRFDAALANMVHGLCMFATDETLVVANARFYALLGLDPGRVCPGTPYREVLAARLAAGSFPGRSLQELLEERLPRFHSGDTGSFLEEVADGRTIVATYRGTAVGGLVIAYEDVTERREAEARIAHIAHHDALTGLPNRVLFRERLDETLVRARRDEGFAVLCLDLDRFKDINDTLGHPAGDALLRVVAERLKTVLRETDTLARLGGDEFAILQPNVDQPGDASPLARRLVEALSAPFDLGGHQVVIGTSVGIALAPTDGLDADLLLKAADMALYRAKAEGRGRWCFFEPEMDARMRERRLLELDLRRALVVGEFELHYQPIVAVASRRVSGLEALLRWRHPERGLVPPDAFIPLAEEIGLIVPLGEWVLAQACRDAAGWLGTPKVAVNLSPVQFASRGLVDAVATALELSGLDPARLELEITETVMLQDTQATLATLHRLKALGVRIAMDDFGTGYSSLSYLQRFPFDKVKIDRSFTSGLEQSPRSNAIVGAVTDLCLGLDMTITAEGVETEEQLQELRRKGCGEAQGYLFSKPQPAAEIPMLLARLAAEVQADLVTD